MSSFAGPGRYSDISVWSRSRITLRHRASLDQDAPRRSPYDWVV